MTDKELNRIIDEEIEKANQALKKLDELDKKLDRLEILINEAKEKCL